jgi:hypothetical protein
MRRSSQPARLAFNGQRNRAASRSRGSSARIRVQDFTGARGVGQRTRSRRSAARSWSHAGVRGSVSDGTLTSRSSGTSRCACRGARRMRSGVSRSSLWKCRCRDRRCVFRPRSVVFDGGTPACRRGRLDPTCAGPLTWDSRSSKARRAFTARGAMPIHYTVRAVTTSGRDQPGVAHRRRARSIAIGS